MKLTKDNQIAILIIIIIAIVVSLVIIVGFMRFNEVQCQYDANCQLQKYFGDFKINFNPESTIDPNETEYEECIRVWNDTIGLELLKDRNQTLAGECYQYK